MSDHFPRAHRGAYRCYGASDLVRNRWVESMISKEQVHQRTARAFVELLVPQLMKEIARIDFPVTRVGEELVETMELIFDVPMLQGRERNRPCHGASDFGKHPRGGEHDFEGTNTTAMFESGSRKIG